MIPTPTFDQRILVGVAATLRWQPVDSDGTAADPGGTVTVSVARADGSAIATDAATSGSSSAERTYSLAAVTTLTWLTATWKVGGTTVATTMIEVVGGYYASLATIRAEEPALTVGAVPDAALLTARWEAEKEAEQWAGVAFVPRYRRARLSGSGCSSLVLPCLQLRSIRSVRRYTDGTTYESFDSDQVASVPADPAGVAIRTDGGTWPAGDQNLVVEWEHGYDRPPADLLRLWYGRVRWFASRPRSAVGEEVTAYTNNDGTRYELGNEFSRYFAKLRDYGARVPGVA